MSARWRRIRDLNDEINKLIREKGHWEVRIIELGGPDYAKSAPRVQDSEGNEVRGATGKGAGYRFVPRCCPVRCAGALNSAVSAVPGRLPMQVFWSSQATAGRA